MINEMLEPVDLPQIINEFAKFDGRRKKYVLFNTPSESNSTLTEDQSLELTRQQLLADLQTKWKQLQYQMPGNLNWLQSIAKYYRDSLNLYSRKFSFKRGAVNYLNSDYHYWGSSLKNFQNEIKLSIQPISKKGFETFRVFASKKVQKECKTEKEVKQAWATIAEFIDYQNLHYMLVQYYYPTLTPSKKAKLNPLTISTNWVTEGKIITRIIATVNAHWDRTTVYNNDEVLGWLLYSGIIYGGINDPYLLAGWLQGLIENQARPFINERVYLSVRYKQSGYGNERIEDSKDIYNTKQIILDMVSQCWLLRYKEQDSSTISQNHSKPYTQMQIKSYIFKALLPVIKPLSIEPPTLSKILIYASYYWEMLDEVSIDQASASVLRGKHNHTGLLATDFERFLNRGYKIQPAVYESETFLKLVVDDKNDTEKPASKKYVQAEVRKSDLIEKVKRSFKLDEQYKLKVPNNFLGYRQITPYVIDSIHKDIFKYQKWKVRLTLSARIIKLCDQYNDLSEIILLRWVNDLLNQERSRNKESVKKYLSTIGYEWLYFTVGQPLQSWTEEDFEEMYDDIFEYKELDRKITDLSYSANFFQRIHNFAVEQFDLAPVLIEQAKSNRRVRSELVSPQAYHAIIKQILESVDILEREMFALLFIFVYRTGMRKKELLGLRYLDIEGLSHNKPSIVVRSNIYRSTKTQGSIRRIAIFALLKPSELALFINYAESNVGNNPNKFIFTLSNAHQPIEDHVPLQLLRKVLKDISIEDEVQSFTFHAFRHTAISNLSMALNGRQDLIEALTDYNSDDVLRIKQGLLGVHIEGSDRWYALSGIMGHLSPKRSFEYYNHIATLMATYELSFADIYLPLKTVNNITGITKKKLIENKAIIESEQLCLTSIRKLLFKSTMKGVRKSPRFTIEEPNSQAVDYDVYDESSELFMRYGINKIELFLNKSDMLPSLKKAIDLAQINEVDANRLLERAHQVTQLMTKHGRPRFVRLDKLGKPLLSPISIQDQSDFRILSILQYSARKLRDHNLNDWQWFIETCSQRLTITTPSVSFVKNKNDDLLRFIKLAKVLLPAKNWLITSNEGLLTERLTKEKVEGIRIHYKENMTTIHIGIVNRDLRANQGRWKYSPLLRFFIHMMMIFDEQIIIK